MKTRFFCALYIVCVLLMVSVAGAEGEEHGKDDHAKKTRNYASIMDLHYIYFINTHVQDLSLTSDQETKLKTLQADMEKEIDAMVEDPEYQSLQKKMQEAKKAKNEDEAKNVLQQIKDFRASKAPTANQASKLILAILTKEQNTKLSELLRAQREKGKGDGHAGASPPDGEKPTDGKPTDGKP
jgi:Spy/CpxP family protein refolding chaperone